MAKRAQKYEDLNWHDLRLCLAIHRHGSVLAASQALGLSHSTVLRRLDALEKLLGARLFERYPTGLEPTQAGELLIATANSLQTSIDDLYLSISSNDELMHGRLRVATADQIGKIIMRDIAAFCEENPGVFVDVTITQNVKSASQAKAHLIAMLSQSPPEGHVGYRIGPVAFGIYGSRERLERTDAAELPWLAHAPSLHFTFQGHLDRWLVSLSPRHHTTDSISAHANAIRAGLGIGLMACGVGDADPTLRRCGPIFMTTTASLWVLHRAAGRTHGPTRLLGARLRDSLRKRAALIQGKTPLAAPLPLPWLSDPAMPVHILDKFVRVD
jgi:molybdate transport repressor ModE-like protein